MDVPHAMTYVDHVNTLIRTVVTLVTRFSSESWLQLLPVLARVRPIIMSIPKTIFVILVITLVLYVQELRKKTA